MCDDREYGDFILMAGLPLRGSSRLARICFDSPEIYDTDFPEARRKYTWPCPNILDKKSKWSIFKCPPASVHFVTFCRIESVAQCSRRLMGMPRLWIILKCEAGVIQACDWTTISGWFKRPSFAIRYPISLCDFSHVPTPMGKLDYSTPQFLHILVQTLLLTLTIYVFALFRPETCLEKIF